MSKSSEQVPLEKLVDKDEYPVKHASDIIGNWGPLQRNTVFFYIAVYLVATFQNVGITFFVPKVDFWCKKPVGYENASLLQCNSYEDPSLPCSEWEYDRSFYKSTATQEFNLVCDRSWMRPLPASLFQVGYGVASIITGLATDRYGRYFVFKWCIVLEILSGISVALSVNMTHFLISRFFLAIGAFGRFSTGATLMFELVGSKVRGRVAVAIEAGWCISYLIMPWVHYMIPHFRYVQLCIVVYEILLLPWLWQLPESPRWLLTHGQFKKAEHVIIKAAKLKGKINEEDLTAKILQLKSYIEHEDELLSKERKKSIIDLWKEPILRKYCVILHVMWFASGFTMYAFSYNAGSLSGSVHVNIFLQGISATIALTIAFFAVDKFPRKRISLTSMVTGTLIVLAIIPFTFMQGGTPFIMTMAMLGSLCFSCDMYTTSLIASETFPTTLRQTAINSLSLIRRVSSTMSPFLTILVDATHVSFMMVFVGVMATMYALLLILLPETKDKEIPDTIEEAKLSLERNLRKNQHPAD